MSFRFNTTLVRRVQPIYRRKSDFGFAFFFVLSELRVCFIVSKICCTLLTFMAKRVFLFYKVIFMISKEKKDYAAELLKQKADELGRVPKKADFDPLEISHIKAYLGPWPRALEYAGLKEPKAITEKPKKRNAGKAKAQRLKGLKTLEKKRSED